MAYIIGTYPQPSETFIAREIAGLRARGHQVTIFSLFVPPAGPSADVEYAWLSAAERLQRKVAPETALRQLASRWRITRDRFDVAVAHFASLPADTALRVVESDLPLLISAHARDLYVEAGDLTAKLERAAALVTCTRANVAYLSERYPAFTRKIHLIYHGLPATWLDAPFPHRARAQQEPLHLLAVGRFVEKKGFATLLAAIARLQPPCTLTLVGAGPLHDSLLRLRDRLGLIGAVTLPGWLDETALRAAYANADLFCCPSEIAADGDRDGLPNVLLEAMASGLPAVGSAISAIPEAIIDEQTGLLVPAGEPATLAAAITRLADPVLRQSLGTRAAAYMREHFAAEEWVKRLEEVLLAVAR